MCYEAGKQFGSKKDLRPLAKILQHQYFNRPWIIQEVLFAKSVRVLTRNVWISWRQMHLVAIPGDDFKDARAVGISFPGWFLIRISGRARTCALELPYVDKYSTFDCADPRDKVYGLLSCIDPLSKYIIVNHNKTACEVFSDLVVVAYAWNRKCQEQLRLGKTSMALHLDMLHNQFVRIGGTALHMRSMKRFLDAVFMNRYPPPNNGIHVMTGMGFESVPSEHWWYDFLDKRYYVYCDESKWLAERYCLWLARLNVPLPVCRKTPEGLRMYYPR